MSLVPYASSDISDSDDEESIDNKNENNLQIRDVQIINSNGTEIDTIDKSSNGLTNSIFHLPSPKNTLKEIIIEEENDEFLQKKPDYNLQEKKPVKITIPSLSQFKEDDDTDQTPIKKFRSANSKGAGLFAVLPPPKGGKIITPAKLLSNKSTNSGTETDINKVNKSNQSQPLLPRVVKKMVEEKLKQKTEANLIKETSEVIEDDNEIDTNDFFSLDRNDENDFEPEIENPIITKTIYPEVNITSLEPEINSENILVSQQINSDYTPLNDNKSNNPLGLDEEALKVLVGSRAKRKMEFESAAIVDLRETDIKPDNREWFQQALLHGTGPEEGTTVKAVPGGILKRKHQITYLAQQAKANEQQLKNQWAQNRASRQQTQSKYGF